MNNNYSQQKISDPLSNQKDLIKRVVRTRRRCAEDPAFFITNFCYTIDTRKTPSMFLMKLWSHQLELLKQLLKYEHLIIEKSRDMGISWLIMAFELHQTMFTNGFTALNISRKETEVEDPGKTFHSLMGRIAFMYHRLPSFLKLKAENPFLTFRVDANNSIIKGESANPNAGRDTQYKFIFIDEAAFIGCLDEMWKGVSNASNCICLNSTPPKESDNKFVKLRFMKNSGFKIMKFHWTEHPEKNDDWYTKKIKTMDEEEVARELDINYEQSKTLRVYAEFTEADYVSTYKFYYNNHFPLIMSFDFGLDGEAVGFYQKDGDDRLFKLWQYQAKDLLTYQHVLNIDKILGKLLFKDKHSDIKCFGDPHGHTRGRVSKQSVIAEYEKYGFHIQTRRVSFDEKRRTVKTVLRNRINSKPQFMATKPTEENKLNLFSKAMLNARMNKQQSDQYDDWTTHIVNEFEYAVCNLFPLIRPAVVSVSFDRNEAEEETIRRIPLHRDPRPASILTQGSFKRRGLIFQ